MKDLLNIEEVNLVGEGKNVAEVMVVVMHKYRQGTEEVNVEEVNAEEVKM